MDPHHDARPSSPHFMNPRNNARPGSSNSLGANGMEHFDGHGHPMRGGFRFDPGPRQADGSALPEDLAPGGRFGPGTHRELRAILGRPPRGVPFMAQGGTSRRDLLLEQGGVPVDLCAPDSHRPAQSVHEPRSEAGGSRVHGDEISPGVTPHMLALEQGLRVAEANRRPSAASTHCSGPAPVANTPQPRTAPFTGGSAHRTPATAPFTGGLSRRSHLPDFSQHPRYQEGIQHAENLRRLSSHDPRYRESARAMREIMEDVRGGGSALGDGQRRVPSVLYPRHGRTRGGLPELFERPE